MNAPKNNKQPRQPAKATKAKGRRGRPPRADSDRDAVRSYLEALKTPLPRGRQVNVDALRSRRDATTDPIERLVLSQKILDASSSKKTDRVVLEKAFVDAAARWSASNHITWSAWKDMGVPVAVLRRAGLVK
jgi:hypothetical protein